ncbi:MAG TPA: phosphoribosylamine--glycine ligase [Acidocella sp.]|jgi:phosphoribosylamine--glycine ligase|uniref:phosphoribosylamine--glycine ligase n=1 Tax=Acidocella sp. TaxID=50710 RepID=UPI002C0100AB|nr:phosphoribosylamine--glycine ligase [Acidocella sp.]HVE23489.1 phosphoribosylamine--glycine ligase [Acidocella sp.]
MRVLIVGSGGREHALAWAISASPLLTELFVAPGNPGTAALATNVPLRTNDIAGLVNFAVAQKVDLVVPGPEAPLVAGLADALAAQNIACCGPSAAAAQLEGSKRFTKEIADAAGIPTAAWKAFTEADEAHDYVEEIGAPIVIKADGLAAGKGVVVAATLDEAHEAVTAIMEDKVHGAAGAEIVIEQCLVGEEISVFALCDGEDALYLGCAADHKRVGDGDTGPNTGGMGAISPPPWAGQAIIDATMATIIRPALGEMARRGMPFRGFLFAGLMVEEDGPKLIEFNVRFGDPECETLLPLLRSDLLPALVAATEGELKHVDLRWRDAASATVVMCSKGYPGAYATGGEIFGLEEVGALPEVTVFHAGTMADQGGILANGGRVLAVNATGADLQEAVTRAYEAVDKIEWADGFCRRDIGRRAIFAAQARK